MAYGKEYDAKYLNKVLEEDFLMNDGAFASGRRNDDCVDSMIICHCLDRDWHEWFAKVADDRQGTTFTKVDIMEVMAHAERIEPYLEKWGRAGTMEAMAYAINY